MEINGKSYSVGADPEVFVGLNSEFVSAHDLVPGTKKKPHRVDKGAVQVDGMALEFNIDPAESPEEFISNIQTVKTILGDMIGDGLEFLQCSSVNFDEKFLSGVPKSNIVMGCESDFNAWTLDANEPPESKSLMRTVGGHVHIGGIHTNRPFGNEHFLKVARLVRILDEELGVPSLEWDKDTERRSMYGKAGCFRPKFYGVEYRTLSNAWIFDTDTMLKVYNGVREALLKFEDPDYEPSPIVQDVVNGSLYEKVA